MQEIVNKNYFLDKLAKDKKINELIENQTEKENKDFFENLRELRKILHFKNYADKKILQEYEKNILIPTGSEETLIRELHLFNKEMYDDFPEYYTLDFENEIINKNLKNNFTSEIDKTFFDFENLLLNEPVNVEDPNIYFDKLLEENDNTIFEDDSKIYVNSEEEKNKLLYEFQKSLSNGHYNKLKLNKPISISISRYMKKLESLRKGFIRTYGSEIFSRISRWINHENSLYENIDHVNKINNLKKQKIFFKKKKFKYKFKKGW